MEQVYCQYCSKVIDDEDSMSALINFDLDEQIKKTKETFVMYIEFDDMLLHVVFPGEDSPDDIKDADVALLCCSMECAETLNREVKKRPDIMVTLCKIRIEGFKEVEHEITSK